jgi:hypothetical protein
MLTVLSFKGFYVRVDMKKGLTIRNTAFFLITTAVMVSVFFMIFLLVSPHFKALDEVFGLALNSEKIKSVETVHLAVLIAGTGGIMAAGFIIKWMSVKFSGGK